MSGCAKCDPAKTGSTKLSVSFSNNIKIVTIPVETYSELTTMFYSTEEITKMKDEALMEKAGVRDSVSADGEDMFEIEALPRPNFLGNSIEKTCRKNMPPVRAEEEIVKKVDKERPPRERGEPRRSRSSGGPSRTDGRRPAGRGPPRRARSDLAGIGQPSTLSDMQAATRNNRK